jgi:hypothetical protein
MVFLLSGVGKWNKHNSQKLLDGPNVIDEGSFLISRAVSPRVERGGLISHCSTMTSIPPETGFPPVLLWQ